MIARLRQAWERLMSQPRQLALVVTAALVIGSALVAQQWLFPAYDRWRHVREEVRLMSMEHERFSRNLQVAAQVDAQVDQLGEAVRQVDSDEQTFSQFLVNLENTATQAGVALVNARPEPVSVASACHLYRVRLSFTGELPAILRFVQRVTDGPSAVGADGVTLRAIQGSRQVEAILTLQMARLEAPPSGGGT